MARYMGGGWFDWDVSEARSMNCPFPSVLASLSLLWADRWRRVAMLEIRRGFVAKRVGVVVCTVGGVSKKKKCLKKFNLQYLREQAHPP